MAMTCQMAMKNTRATNTLCLRLSIVVGKSITTNPGYFSSGRFLNGEGIKRLLFPQLGSLVKVKRF
jgi:hypothetical protein